MVVQRLTQITPPAATPDQLRQREEAAWSVVPREHMQSLIESMRRRVAAVISYNGEKSIGSLARQRGHQVTKMVPKKEVNSALSPRFCQVRIESPL
ncbi:hypothetical protein TNCV_1670231 [Trichonephila clavipes]|nr:hypothetical protein TNCV_1670231 [Trichonephila clavipes]